MCLDQKNEVHCSRTYRWLGCRLCECSISSCNTKFFSKVVVLVYTSTSSSHSSTSLLMLAIVRFLLSARQVGVIWHLVVVLICIFLFWEGLFPFFAADLNNIKFSAYRTAMKLRRVQKALRRKFPISFPLWPSPNSSSSSSIGCFPLSSHLGQGCWLAWWELSKGWNMLAVDTSSFQGPSILPKSQTCFQVNPQLFSSLSLPPCPIWMIKQLFCGKKYASTWSGATRDLCCSAILGLLNVAAEQLKQMSVVSVDVPSGLSRGHCAFSLPGPGMSC